MKKSVCKNALALAFSLLPLLPSAASPYLSNIRLDSKEYVVEVDELRKLIQTKAEDDGKAEKAAMKAFVSHQKSILHLQMNELDYEIWQLASGSISKSKDLSSKIKSLGDLFKVKLEIPWWSLALMKLDAKVLACGEVLPVREDAKNYLDVLEKSEPEKDARKLNEFYNRLKALSYALDSAISLIKDTIESTDPRFIMTSNELSDLKKEIHYANAIKIEEKMKSMKDRFYESKEYRDYSQKKSRKIDIEDIEDVLGRYEIINSLPKPLFDGDYPVLLYTQSQFDSPLKASVKIKVEKSLEKNEDYNLKLSLLLKDYDKRKMWPEAVVFNKSKSSLFIFHPSSCDIGISEQSIYSLRAGENSELQGKLEEVAQLGKDKRITMKLNASKSAFKKALKLLFPGKLMVSSNLSEWISKKIVSSEEKKKEEKKQTLLERLYDDYEPKEIQFYPSNSQASAYFFSIPVENQDSPIYAMLNIGIQDWMQHSTGVLENLVIEIPQEGSAKKYEEEMVIPARWLKRIDACSYQIRASEGGYAGFLRSIARDAPSPLQGAFSALAEGVIQQNSLDSRPSRVASCQPKENLLKQINSEVLKLRRKDYGWILSEPWIKNLDQGRIDVLTSLSRKEYEVLDSSNSIPNSIITSFGKTISDEEFLKEADVEKLGEIYCNLVLSKDSHSYDCYAPCILDSHPHVEFVDNLKDYKSMLSQLEGIYFQTKVSFKSNKQGDFE